MIFATVPIQYATDDYWVRTQTDENQYALYDNRFTFGVQDPSHVVTVAVFDDRSDLLIPSGPKYLGKFRIRPCTLGIPYPLPCLHTFSSLRSQVTQGMIFLRPFHLSGLSQGSPPA